MFLHSPLSALARFGYRRWKAIALLFLLILATSPLLLKGLRFESFTSGLEVSKDSLAGAYRENLARFGESSPLVILLEYPDIAPAVVDSLTDALAARLATWPDVVSVEAKLLDLAKPSEAALLLRAALFNSGPDTVKEFVARFAPDAMREELLRTRKKLLALENPGLRDRAAADVLNIRELVQPFFESRLVNLKFSRLGEYFDSKDRNARLVFVQASRPAEDAEFSIGFVRRLDAAIEKLKGSFPGAAAIRHRYAGKHALSAETVDLLKKEMKLVTTVASVLVFFLIVAAFKRFRVVLISFLPLSISLVMILIFARFFFNPLNYVALSFASVIFGLGDDVTVHLTVRFFQCLRGGHPAEDAVEITLADCGPPVVINMSTTAAAFCCLGISNYKPVSQFGLLTACGLFITAGVCFLLFPTIVRVFWSRKPAAAAGLVLRPLPRRLSTLSLSRPWFSLAAALLFVGAGAFFARGFSFEMNMMKLMPKRLEALDSARFVSRLFGASFISSLELTIAGEDHEDTMRAQRALETRLLGLVREKKIAGFQSASLFLPLATDPASPAGGPPLPVSGIDAAARDSRDAFFGLLEELRFKKSPEYERYYRILEEAGSFPHDPQQRLRAAGDILPQVKKFAAVEAGKLFLQTYVWPENDLDDLGVIKGIDREFRDFELPPGVFLRRTSTYQVYEEINRTVRADFYRVSLLSFLVIVGILFFFFRRVSDLIICLLPVVGAVTTTLGFVVFARIAFTPAEIGVNALILGIGIAYAVHIVARASSAEGKTMQEVMPEVGPAILLTSLTTIAGFASLMLARSVVTFTLGAVIAFGIFACLVFTFLIVPPVHKLLRGR